MRSAIAICALASACAAPRATPLRELTELETAVAAVLADPRAQSSTTTAVLGERVYEIIFEPAGAPKKPATIDVESLRKSFLAYSRSLLVEPWMVRAGMAGQNEAGPLDTVRLYMNLLPDGTPAAVDVLTNALNDKNVKFTVKVAATLADFSRSSTGVLYVARNDYRAARAALEETARRVPRAFTDPITPLTKRITAGISAADEPDSAHAPKTRPQHSFGSFIADVIAEALFQKRDISLDAAIAQVRERFTHYGVDPDRLYLRRGRTTDDL